MSEIKNQESNSNTEKVNSEAVETHDQTYRGGSSEERTPAPSAELQQMQNKIKNLEALVVDLNNKLQTQTTQPQPALEFPKTPSEKIDAFNASLKKEWGLN